MSSFEDYNYSMPPWMYTMNRRKLVILTVFWGIFLPPLIFVLIVCCDPSILPDDRTSPSIVPEDKTSVCSGDHPCPSISTIPPPTSHAITDPDYSPVNNIYDKIPSLPRLLFIVFAVSIIATLLYRFVNCLCAVYTPPAICSCSFACCLRRQPSERDSAGSLYPPPRYSQCGSFYTAPPPYSEVTSKPDLYPLVITCGDGDGKSGGNYLMVHYFRDYLIRAPGSLSATSTAESLSSNYLCNATNEANTIIPPPYSSASNYEGVAPGRGRPFLRSLSSLTEPCVSRLPTGSRSDPNTFRENLITSPVQHLDRTYDLELELIDCEMYCDGDCKPRLGPSPPTHRSPSNAKDCTCNLQSLTYERETYGLRHMYSSPEAGACESPPQPTSPTQTSRDSTLRRANAEKPANNSSSRKSSLYMPLCTCPGRNSRISHGARASSRSAPATPCGALVPNLLTFAQRASRHSKHGSRSSKVEEENNPLLTDVENGLADDDHKF